MNRRSASGAARASVSCPSPPPQPFTYGEVLRRALAWVLRPDIFENLPQHGNTSWTPLQLVSLAVLWVWSDQARLTDAFDEACRVTSETDDPAPLGSYQGFIRALAKWTARLRPRLWARLQHLMRQIGDTYWRCGEFVVLAVDGSRVSTPRTESNERAFAARNYGRGKKARRRSRWKNKAARTRKLGEPVRPQIWLTLLWHVGLKMPWCWRTGPSNANERAHLGELLESEVFPEKTLFCGDAGFTGYEFWKQILERGHNFLVRVGGNVRLVRKLGHARLKRDLVYVWPNRAARRQQPPLILRLLEFQGPRGPVFLLTSVLDAKRLPPKLARDLYRRRWGVELQFRALKQTFGRGKLRSRTADRAVTELEWSLFGLWLIQLFAVKEQLQIDSPPERGSVALAIGVFRELLRAHNRIVAGPRFLGRSLCAAVADNYQRTRPKRARYRLHYVDPPSARGPKVTNATPAQQRRYRKLTTASDKCVTA
jgi:hypothetical protein